MTSTTAQQATASTDGGAPVEAEVAERLDGFVDRAQRAAEEFRRLDQEAVDRIVWAMVAAGSRERGRAGRLAMEETGFGVFEDKVVKNYIATEFLYDYLKDKRSVGVDRRGPERNIELRRRADRRRARAAADHQPDLDRAVQVDRRRQDPQRDDLPPLRPGGAAPSRAIEILREAGEAAGLPADALQVIPDPTLDVSQYLFHHPGVDLIWTTGGPKAVAAANAAGKPCISVGSGNAPVYVHASADVRMAVVDILISKTFDASVICPAEQTCVIDDADLRRHGRRVRAHGRPRCSTADEVERLAAATFDEDGEPADVGARPVVPSTSAALAGIESGDARQGAARAAALRPRRARPPPVRRRRS